MRFELQSVSVWSVIKIAFFVNLAVGFLFGLPSALFFGLMSTVAQEVGRLQGGAAFEDMSIGMLVVVLPIVFATANAFFGTIICAIAALIFNLVARLLGGIELNLVDISPQPHAASAASAVPPAIHTVMAPAPVPPPQPPIPPQPPARPSEAPPDPLPAESPLPPVSPERDPDDLQPWRPGPPPGSNMIDPFNPDNDDERDNHER